MFSKDFVRQRVKRDELLLAWRALVQVVVAQDRAEEGLARVRPQWHRQLAKRRVAFCGEYLVAPHAEGAAASGVRAAHEIIDLLRGSPATG